MLRSIELERARQRHYQEIVVGDVAPEFPPEGPFLVRRDDKTGEPWFHVHRLVDGQWAGGDALADELSDDEVAALPADERAVAVEWRARIEAVADVRDPEFATLNAEPRPETLAECIGEAASAA